MLLRAAHEPSVLRVAAPHSGTRLSEAQRIRRPDARPMLEVEATYGPGNAAVSAASSDGVPPFEPSRGGTPRELAGEDACATLPDGLIDLMRDCDIVEAAFHEPVDRHADFSLGRNSPVGKTGATRHCGCAATPP